LTSLMDRIFTIAFASAHTAIFDVGSLMAVLILLFGTLDYKYGEKLRGFIVARKLDQPWIMAALALIPVDGTLLFQFTTYRRKGIRFGSLLGGLIGIGEEATYLVMTYQPLAWLMLAGIKLVTATVTGTIINALPRVSAKAEKWHEADQAASVDEGAVKADINFHELPDKYRHLLHHFRYHTLGTAFWIFFGVVFVLEVSVNLLDRLNWLATDSLTALGIPFISWLAMLALFVVVVYFIVYRMTTREFGKIFEHEFEDLGDALGDLAETCASVILLIFVVSFAVQAFVGVIGLERIGNFFAGRGLLAVLIAALIGLIPGTGASLTFTALYFTLQGSPGAMPFAALAACSICLIGDSQFIGMRQIKHSQRIGHAITFVLAILVGLAIYFVERLL
jgi:hypothetical protein